MQGVKAGIVFFCVICYYIKVVLLSFIAIFVYFFLYTKKIKASVLDKKSILTVFLPA
jgi:hypothetical protein